MDIVNTLELMIPKMRQQMHLKKINSLDTVYDLINENGKYFPIKDLDLFFAKLGIFLKSQEVTELLNHCQHSKTQIDLVRMVELFKTEVPKDIVRTLEGIFNKLSNGLSVISVDQLLKTLNESEHPQVDLMGKNIQKVHASVLKGLKTIIGNNNQIKRDEFLEFHYNIFWTLPDYRYEDFRNRIYLMWGVRQSKDTIYDNIPTKSSASKVYFTKIISPQKVVEMFKILKKNLPGKVAVKVHSGEKGNFNFIKPEMWVPVRDYVKGTFVECNTAYQGQRNTTEKHKKVLEEHGWNKAGGVDILDAEGPDDTLKIPHGILIKENYVGKRMKNYNSALVCVHFKGHVCGGYGGALKQLSIGFGSTAGKAYQHSGGKSASQDECWKKHSSDKEFKEAMADAAWSIVDFFKGNLAYVAVMANISIDCDCCDKPEKPAIPDIGILSSTDPVALDQACLDLVYKSNAEGKAKLINRIEGLLGPHIIECAVKLGIGKKEYELINVD